GNAAAAVTHPRDVSKDRARAIKLTPEVEQVDLVPVDGAVDAGCGEVMRIAGVFRRRDHGLRVGHQPGVTKPSGYELLDVVFGRREPVAHALRNRVKGPA